MERMRFCALRIPHYVAEPDGLGDALNLFLFYDLYPSAVSGASLITRRWDYILVDKHLYILRVYTLSPRKPKICPSHKMGRRLQAIGGVDSLLRHIIR